jgi:Holliday junction DNA helicase RuvA
MYEYIRGNIVELNPTFAILENSNLAYRIEISLQTYSSILSFKNQEIILYTHLIIREDAHFLYGFSTKQERDFFKLLISVSGVGANTARTILSASSCNELINYIQQAKVSELKNIKGIGQKTAERLIVELRDKIGKVERNEEIFTPSHNTIKEEALSALIMLGYNKNIAEKTLDKILKNNPNLTTEELIKQALKLM